MELGRQRHISIGVLGSVHQIMDTRAHQFDLYLYGAHALSLWMRVERPKCHFICILWIGWNDKALEYVCPGINPDHYKSTSKRNSDFGLEQIQFVSACFWQRGCFHQRLGTGFYSGSLHVAHFSLKGYSQSSKPIESASRSLLWSSSCQMLSSWRQYHRIGLVWYDGLALESWITSCKDSECYPAFRVCVWRQFQFI